MFRRERDDVRRRPGIALSAIALAAVCATAAGEFAVAGEAAAAPEARAQQSNIKVFKYKNRSGVTSFSDRAPIDRRYEVVKVSLSCYACNLKSTVDWHNTPLHLNAFQDTISNTARNYSVDPALVRAVIHAESAFKPRAKSSAGALGLMQLMPATAREMGVTNPLSPEDNIRGGVRYLAWLLQKTRGNTTLATAAYNAGPGAVERHNGIPPYEETRTYVRRVEILHQRYKNALAKTT